MFEMKAYEQDYKLKFAATAQHDTKPITNRQWFKNLIQEASDEDLAKYYAAFCNFCIYKDIPKCYKIHDCHTGHLEWLKAEHKE